MPNAPLNITETEFLKWAEKVSLASFFRSSPSGKCFAIIFQSKSAFIGKNDIFPLVSCPVAKNLAPLDTVISLLQINEGFALSLVTLCFILMKNAPY